MDETLQALSRQEIEAIVVGIPNAGKQRMHEYTPFEHPRMGGGSGDEYLAFVVETLKPLVDSDFRTLPGRRYTGMIGSSLGGLITLYAFFRYPEIFGLAAAMSPSLWFQTERVFAYVRQAPRVPGRLYLDVGIREGAGRFSADVRKLYRLLLQKGYRRGEELLFVEDPDGIHHESAWGRRLPRALRFLLGSD